MFDCLIFLIIFRTSEPETRARGVSSTPEEITGTHNHQNVGGLGASANMIGGNVEGNVNIGDRDNGLTLTVLTVVFVLLMAVIVYQILKNEAKIISQ